MQDRDSVQGYYTIIDWVSQRVIVLVVLGFYTYLLYSLPKILCNGSVLQGQAILQHYCTVRTRILCIQIVVRTPMFYVIIVQAKSKSLRHCCTGTVRVRLFCSVIVQYISIYFRALLYSKRRPILERYTTVRSRIVFGFTVELGSKYLLA